MTEVECLLSELDGDEIQEFAEDVCGWTDTEYYNECEQEGGDYYHPDDMSIVDSACEAIRDWVELDPSILDKLRNYVTL